jgi:Oxaloacetate decarboxylase, gamma chain
VLGIAAITANNGWSMAFTGACIVMIGLAALAFVISQLHRIIALMEGVERKTSTPQTEVKSSASNLLAADIDILNDLPAAARIYGTLTQEMGDTFPLVALYRILEKENLPHPHITITALRDVGFLVPVGEGKFSWANV